MATVAAAATSTMPRAAACSAPRAALQPSTSGRCTLAAARGARGLGAAALPRRPSLRPRQQQQLAVCSLTSHPGEVSARAGGCGGPTGGRLWG